MTPYDDKDCTGWDLSDRTDMDGITIHGLCLSNEAPNAQVLPPTLTGVTFIACNLDNVHIPDGNIVDPSCSTRRFKVQNDGEDWLIDGDGNPTSPVNPHIFISYAISTDPKDIPDKPSELSIVAQKQVARCEFIATMEETISDMAKEP